jgi:hypothetical protein
MLGKLRSRLKKNPRISGLRLSVAEKLLPPDYYVQLRPPYATHRWEADRRHYDEKHDWKNFRDGNRVLQAHVILDRVKSCAFGDYAELGTYQGNYARIIYSQMVEGASLYCFDTFTGFPKTSVEKELETTGHAVSVGTFSDTCQAKVERTIAGRTSPPQLVLRAGEFPTTFGGLEDHRWRFVLLDADLYAPIKAGLELFWPRLVAGGFILCHDYLSGYPGVRKAVHEFFDPLGIVPVPWPDRVGTAVVGKP